MYFYPFVRVSTLFSIRPTHFSIALIEISSKRGKKTTKWKAKCEVKSRMGFQSELEFWSWSLSFAAACLSNHGNANLGMLVVYHCT